MRHKKDIKWDGRTSADTKMTNKNKRSTNGCK